MTEQLKCCHLQAEEIRRYTLLGGLIAGDPSSGKYVEYEDYLLVVKHLLTIIKKQEAEKETRYQEGKSEIISKLINDVPNPGYIDEFVNQFTTCKFDGDYKDIRWNEDKLNQYFNVDRDFESLSKKIRKLLLFICCGSVCLDTGSITKKEFFETILSNEWNRGLNVYLEQEINEIKAQGIEEALKKADGEIYIYPIGTDALKQLYRAELKCYAETLRAKHD